ncbi:TonB-dependent receptor [Mucilaginibacter sabulilitoris]|uniref:TonB-dependent receptor n=1 Tax=Mucilaginibacter sabulilitoris TaxID=1173583 RepID=A0ABZ0TN18_9SPHI|nr:TonB-dependent receptor [Mucilaginibacter sabulilitoris]WPU94559.1 TonB-dependent receptor [Mucilaginibacter sabulilitoris]
MINFDRKSAMAVRAWQKTIKIMKLVTVLLLTGIMHIHAAVYSQNVYNFNVNNISVKQMFKQIEKTSKYTVFYRLDQVNIDKKINVELADASIETVMKNVLQNQPLTFQVVDDIIIIKPANDKTIAAVTVTGLVKDINGNALPGVSVKLAGSTLGTVTDINGKYSLTLPDGTGTLEFSFLGFTPQRIPVNGQTTINVTLSEESKALNEVVVVGYTTLKKKDLTGAVAVVNTKDLNKTASSSVNSQLQGQAAGVTVTGSGQPGEEPQVHIRGFNTFGNNTPLYVVDGIPTYDVSTMNPNDIESLQVLKDASSASIYGSRAANGVIIITTKKGKGKVNIQYDAYYGTQVPKGGNVWNILSPTDMATLKKTAQTNSGATEFQDDQYNPSGVGSKYTLPDYITPAGAKNGSPEVNPSLYYVNPFYTSPDDFNNFYRITKANKAGTDWYHEIFKSAPMTSHNLTLSGSTDQASYLFSLNYFNQQGTLIDTYLKRYTLRSNTSFNITKSIRVGENLAYSISRTPQIADGTTHAQISANNADGVITMALREQPIVPVYDIKGNYAGSYGSGLGDANNPVAIQQRTRVNGSTDYRLFGNMFAEADIIKGLTLRTSFGGDITNGSAHAFSYPTYENVENSLTNSYSEDSYNNYSFTWTNTLTYQRLFGKHDLKVVAGTEAAEGHNSSVGGSRQGYFNFDPNYVNLSTGSASGLGNYSDRSSTSLFSEFARLDYTYADKYLFNATIRRDGASQFSKNNQYGYFPAFSAGWRISQESFLRDVKWITDLKIRGGWGIMGNQININGANAYTTFNTSIGQSYYPINGGPDISPGFYQNQIANSNAKWEKDVNTNFGFDATLFDGNIAITADYYRKDIRDLLFNAKQLGTAGNGDVPFVNVGKMKTDGLDISVTGNFRANSDLNFTVTGTATTYSNKILNVSQGANYFYGDVAGRFDGFITRNQVGHSLGEFYGYQIVGFWNTQAEINAADAGAQKVLNDPAAVYQTDNAVGRFKYKDVNGDGVITPDDRTFIGNPNPKVTAGLNLGVNYKNFDASIFMYGSFGNKLWNSVKYWTDFYAGFETAKSHTALYDSWTPSNHNAKAPIQEINASTSSGSTPNSYFVENGTYVRIRNAQIGYTFNIPSLKKAGIQKLRIYASATNLLTITGYSGTDPELGGSTNSFGIDEGSYASPRTFLFGVNFSL